MNPVSDRQNCFTSQAAQVGQPGDFEKKSFIYLYVSESKNFAVEEL